MQKLNDKITWRIVYPTMLFLTIGLVYLISVLVNVQIVNHEYLKQSALAQWTSGQPITPVRGTIYDSKGRKLAISVKKNNIFVRPKDLASAIDDNQKIMKDRQFKKEHQDIQLYTSTDQIAQDMSELLGINFDDLKEKIESDSVSVTIKKGVDQTTAEKLRDLKMPGVDVIEDSSRFYPKGRMASYVIGHTSDEGVGQYGIESYMNTELSGTEGKYITVNDARGGQLPNTEIRKYPAVDGNNVYLTLDARIQEIVEDAISLGEINTGAKKVAAIVMDPNNGDILAMASTPGYDLNNPRDIQDEEVKNNWDNLSEEEQQEELFKMWRNYNVSDAYDPGSTFKPLVVCGALEEDVIDEDYAFTCDGFLTDIKSDTPIRCWRWYDPHGYQTLEQGLANSCNDMMGDIGLKLGGNLLHKYMTKLGYGDTTGINITGEGAGIIPAAEDIKDATLANVSFGQGLSATPIQHITALASIANGGNLVTPNVIKEVRTIDGKVKEESEPVIRRKVFSEEKSKEVLEMLGFTASHQYKNFLSVPGYNIGAKTGTSQKIVNGKYSNERYVGSFVGIAPLEDPKFIVLVVIDEPSRGQYYGSEVAGPVGETIMNETLKYMKIEPTKDINENDNLITVPDVRNMTLKEARETLSKAGLDYQTAEYYMTPEDIVETQEPLPGELVPFRSFVNLTLIQNYDPAAQKVPTEEEMLETERAEAEARREKLDSKGVKGFTEEEIEVEEEEEEEEKVLRVPNLKGKSYEEVLKIIEKLGVRLSKQGEAENGSVVSQKPAAGTEIKPDTVIEIKLK